MPHVAGLQLETLEHDQLGRGVANVRVALLVLVLDACCGSRRVASSSHEL